jgi:hypothetical protein
MKVVFACARIRAAPFSGNQVTPNSIAKNSHIMCCASRRVRLINAASAATHQPRTKKSSRAQFSFETPAVSGAILFGCFRQIARFLRVSKKDDISFAEV